jgi:hypothetical protein
MAAPTGTGRALLEIDEPPARRTRSVPPQRPALGNQPCQIVMLGTVLRALATRAGAGEPAITASTRARFLQPALLTRDLGRRHH